MASTQKFFSRNSVELLEHDEDATGAGTVVAYRDMRDFDKFAGGVMTSVLGGSGVTQLEIVAADDNSGTNLTVIKDSGVIAADAVGDQAMLECTAEEIRQASEDAGYTLRYVGLRITHQHAGDESVAVYIRSGARFSYADLTPATTIA